LLYLKMNGVLPTLLQLIYLGDGRLLKSRVTDSDVEGVEKDLHLTAEKIFTAIERSEFPPKPSRLCDWCYFKKICPAFN